MSITENVTNKRAVSLISNSPSFSDSCQLSSIFFFFSESRAGDLLSYKTPLDEPGAVFIQGLCTSRGCVLPGAVKDLEC